MYFDPTISVAFTGHRTYDGAHGELLAQTLRELYSEGFRAFLCGMAVGFDMAAAEAVVTLSKQHADVELVCVVPFAGQERRFRLADRKRYRTLLSQAAVVDYLRPNYDPMCYTLRNDRLVTEASVVVAWYDGSSGGTDYTVRKAHRSGLRIINLCEPTGLFK